MWKLIPWRLLFLIVGLLLLALLAAGQAITFAWLSSFPERASEIGSLRIKFWSYATISVVLIFVDLALAVRLFRRIRDSQRAAKGRPQ
jgi:membrane protein implicated in regulation of membrane protease activity